MLSFAIALNIAVFTLFVYTYIKRFNFRLIFGLFMMPTLFWILGGVYIILIVSVIIFEWVIVKPKNSFRKIIPIILVAFLLYFFQAFVSRYIVSYPMNRILEGLNYYRYPLMMPAVKNIILVTIVLIPIVIFLLHRFIEIRYFKLTSIILFLIIFGGGALKVNSILDLAKEEAFAYDYMVRMRMWKEIIEKAEAKEPSSSMAMTCLNLALAKTGQLGERMFTFHQNEGKESLLPQYERDMTTPLFAGEVYYHLGMINTAQRFAYEAMESIPDYQKSVRCYKRLAETNIINGNYKVAAQYLRILSKTFYYKQWAQKMLRNLYNEDAINSHVELGRLRELCYKDDIFFNYKNIDVMLAFLLKSNSGNRIAFEYLMALNLAERNLQGFLKYYSLGNDIPFGIIPSHFQEALIFLWTVNQRPLDELPWHISPQIIQKINVFASKYNSNEPGMMETLYKDFGDTYWYFLLVQK